MSVATLRLIAAAVGGLAAAIAVHLWRGYGPELATVTGIAVALLVFATQRTVERLRDTVGRGRR